LLSGVGGSGPQGVTVRKIAENLSEPMGLRILGGDIYVMQRTELSKFTIPSGTALASPVRVVGGWKAPDGDWTYGLLYKDGAFYGTQGGWNASGTTGPDRSGWLKLTAGKGYTQLAGGLRNANGIGFGPEGEMFATDNQGNWLPSSKLIHLVPGRFYGCRNNTVSPFISQPEAPPAVWIPHGDIGFSPSEPIMVPAGTYQGQMLAGDVKFGGIQRFFLEKVRAPGAAAAEYQGAVFRFSGGFECGVNRLLFDSKGAIYVAGVGGNSTLGDLGGWGQNGKWTGLQKLVPNGKAPFDMLAMRSVADGFEIEFTQPADGAGIAAKCALEHWRYQPTSAYGGPKIDQARLTLQSATLSPDGKRLRLKVTGMKTGFVVHLKITGLKSSAGEDLWAKDAWYTLNNIGPAEPIVAIAPANKGGDREAGMRVASHGAQTDFEIPVTGAFTLEIRDYAGRKLAGIEGNAPGTFAWKHGALAPGLYAYRLIAAGHAVQSGRFPGW
jgi:hypothetical protein